jgi:DNA-binding PucR family transcriptional regulator
VLVAAIGEGGAPGEALLDATAARLARRLGEGAIGAEAFGMAVVLLPDPDAPGRRRRIEAAVGDRSVALGQTVPWSTAADSATRAAAAHRLAAAGRLPDAGLLVAEDHLPALLLAADPRLAADLAAGRLAPLADLPDGPRERLTETLRAWVDRPGQIQAIAAALDVHPQTVRYRIRQLRDLFGERLEDPEARFELALALRAR